MPLRKDGGEEKRVLNALSSNDTLNCPVERRNDTLNYPVERRNDTPSFLGEMKTGTQETTRKLCGNPRKNLQRIRPRRRKEDGS